jgi:hypothetical protein
LCIIAFNPSLYLFQNENRERIKMSQLIIHALSIHVSIIHRVFLQTEITVDFMPTAAVHSYELEWKQYPQSWASDAQRCIFKTSDVGATKKIRANATDLDPGMTYTIRVVCKDGSGNRGKPGPDLIIDTEAVSCTPKPSCIIL